MSNVFKGCLREKPLEGISHVKGISQAKQSKSHGLREVKGLTIVEPLRGSERRKNKQFNQM